MSFQVRVRRGWSWVIAAVVLSGLSCLAPPAHAQVNGPPDSPLLDQQLVEQYTQLEARMAFAVAVLDQYNSDACPDGCYQSLESLYEKVVNPMVNEAARVAGSQGSVSPQALNLSLRALGPEELFALGPVATGFAQGQLNTLNNRISAVRSLSRARLFARNVVSDALKYGYAAADGIPAGAAGVSFSRFNFFVDTTVGFGSRADTTGYGGTDTLLDTGMEDAFDFDAAEFTLGGDWRFSDNLVVGGLLGYSDRGVKFDPDKSFATGHVDASGFSLIGFAQWDEMRWYGNFALGFQQLGYKTLRRVPIGAADELPVLVGAAGKPDSKAVLASLNAGLPFQRGAWGADLYLNAAFQRQSIDAFTERQVDDGGSPETSGFLFRAHRQNIKSFDTALGVKLQYVATPGFGVLIPFLRSEYHRELEGSRRNLRLEFAGLDGIDEETQAILHDAFQVPLPSDRPDKSWVSLTGGLSAVIRGSNRVSAAGRSSGGLQAYLQYMTTVGLAHYDTGAISAGVRYEF